MGRKMKDILKRLFVLMLTAIICVNSVGITVYAADNWDGVARQSVYETGAYKVTFTLDGHWNGGFNARIRIENIGESVIQNWHLGFDFANKISSIWNAEVCEKENGKYIVKNVGWNEDIPVGGFVEFGFSTNENFIGFPNKYEILGGIVKTDVNDYTVDYKIDSDWGSGFTGTIKITNNTNETLEDWSLMFDFERSITNIWNAQISSCVDNHYTIMNAGYNSDIPAGETISIGFMGEGGNAQNEPYNYQLYSFELQNNMDVNADRENDGVCYFGL